MSVARGSQPKTRDDTEKRHIPDAVVTGAIVTGHASSIQDKRDARPVQCAVHDHLVDRTVEEGGVDGHYRMKAGVGHACRACGRVLLRDAHVEGALGELLRKPVQPCRSQHRGRDGHDIR